MKRAFIALSVVVFVLLGCGNSKQETVNVCDTSLQRCVSTLGEQHKEKCYETYHVCMTGIKK